jgi:hypothetical protein
VIRRTISRIAGPVPTRHWIFISAAFLIAYVFWRWAKHPWDGDSLYYTAMTYRYAGYGLEDAIHQTGLYFGEPDIGRLHYGFTDPVIGPLIYPRVVLPALSLPFVLLFGGSGMWVVPFLSGAFVVWGLTRLLTRLFDASIAVVGTLAFVCTASFLEFGTGLYTEAPALAFAVALLLLLPMGERGPDWSFGWKAGLGAAACIVLISFSRQAGPILVSAICGAWLWTTVRQRAFRRNPWTKPVLYTLPAGLISTAVLQWWAPYDIMAWFVKINNEPNTAAALRDFFPIAWRDLASDAYGYFPHDLIMLAIWLLALAGCVYLARSPLTGMMVGGLVPSLILSTLNSVPSSFRYYVPMYPIMVVMAVTMACSVFARTRDTRIVGVDMALEHIVGDDRSPDDLVVAETSCAEIEAPAGVVGAALDSVPDELAPELESALASPDPAARAVGRWPVAGAEIEVPAAEPALNNAADEPVAELEAALASYDPAARAVGKWPVHGRHRVDPPPAWSPTPDSVDAAQGVGPDSRG